MDAEAGQHIKRLLDGMRNPVTLVYLTQEHACATCRQQQHVLEEVAGLSDRLRCDIHELKLDAEVAQNHGIDKVPATVVQGERDRGIRFFGVTAGYEFMSLILFRNQVERKS
jgi:alkyl hydroperoxide reductase subunit AhpF